MPPLLTPTQITSLEQSIADAEKLTSAQIVVVIANRSGRYDRAEDLFGLSTAILAIALAWVLWQDFKPDTSDWSSGDSTIVLGLLPVLGILILWTFLGAALATRFPILARPFIPRAQVDTEVRRRGHEAFHTFRLASTRARNAILIFISLQERTVWVCPDDALADKLKNNDGAWSDVRDLILAGFRTRAHAAALAKAITRCAHIAAPHAPPSPSDTNELPNTIRFLA